MNEDSFAESLRDDYYSLKRKNDLGPGSFDIVREFDRITKQPKAEAKKENEKNEESSLNLSLSKSKSKTFETPGPGLYDLDKIKSRKIPMRSSLNKIVILFLSKASKLLQERT